MSTIMFSWNTRWTIITLAAVIGCLLRRAAHSQNLEISYAKLDARFYRSRDSNQVYGESDFRLMLGCMLPGSMSEKEREEARRRVKWSKDETGVQICDSPQLPLACNWDDYVFERGATVLDVQLEAHDDLSNGFLGSGTYTCQYHDQDGNQSGKTSARIWVAGKYLEIRVNGVIAQNRSHELPSTNVVDHNQNNPYVLECIIGAGLRNVPSNVKVKWYRNGKLITASSKYGLDETGKKLEIRAANGNDEGVYMCEAEINSRIYGPTSSQYVILHGQETSSSTVFRGRLSSTSWWWLFQSCILPFGVIATRRRLISSE